MARVVSSPPVFRGGLKSDRISRSVAPYDIAPTLAAFHEIKPPSAAIGEVLPEMLER